MSDCGCEMEARNEQERKTLLVVLGINAFMFVFELALGLLAQSTGLIADSLDTFHYTQVIFYLRINDLRSVFSPSGRLRQGSVRSQQLGAVSAVPATRF